MDQIGKVAGALVSSPRSSTPSSTTTVRTVITPPVRIDHFADVAIPRRVWSAFIPKDGKTPREIVRPLMESERLTLERRIAVLEPAMARYHPSERDRVARALGGLYDSYPSMKNTDKAEAVARLSKAMQSLDDQPAWAIEEVCLSIRRYGWRDADGKLQQHWAPSDAEIHSQIDKLIDGRRQALAQAKAILAAPLEPAAIEREAAGIEASLADFKSKVGTGAELDEQEENRRAEVMARSKARSLEERRREYIEAGFEPPLPKFGFITSLPMMLKNGWTVGESKGKKILISPKPEAAP